MILTQRPTSGSDFRPRIPSPLKNSFCPGWNEDVHAERYKERVPQFQRHYKTSGGEIPEFGERPPLGRRSAMYAEHSYQEPFPGAASQRQARVEFLRHRSRERSQDQRELHDTDGSPSGSVAYEHRLTPRDRIEAAIVIQRAYRAHRALVMLKRLEECAEFACDIDYDTEGISDYVRVRTEELAEFGALLDAAPHATKDSGIVRRTLRVTETIYRAIEQIEHVEMVKKETAKVVNTDKPYSGLISTRSQITLSPIVEEDSSESDFDDNVHRSWDGGEEQPDGYGSREPPPSADGAGQGPNSSDSDSDDSDNESIYEFYSGEPEPEDTVMSEKRVAAILSLCSGTVVEQEWVLKVLMAPGLKQPGPRPSVSRLPALLTIAEDKELVL